MRWDPFRELEDLQEQVNRIFQERKGRAESGERVWAPIVDIYEDEDKIVLLAEIPGAKKEDIDIEMTDDSVTIRGERKFVSEQKQNYLRVERPYGKFARTFAISTPINAADVKASYKDGILEISIPKAEAIKPKKIEVTAE